MDGGPATAGLPAAVAEWTKFLARAERDRLNPDVFADFVPILASKHRLPPVLVADLMLRPTKANQDVLDPRVPQYLQVLLKLKLVDTPALLKALYRYSTSHTYAVRPPQKSEAAAAATATTQKQQEPESKQKEVVRWRNSYASEELIFWRQAKAVNQGVAIKSSGEAVEVVRIVAKWMALFADVAAAVSGDTFGAIHSLQAKEEMESTRQAFMLLLVGVCENATVLSSLGKPSSKGEAGRSGIPVRLLC